MPDFNQLIALADAISKLGFTGGLVLILILILTGRIHSDQEKKDWEEDQEYREKIRAEAVSDRLEAIKDRRAADAAVVKITETMKESNDLMRRSIDLNERLVDEFVRPNRGGP